MFDKHHKFYKQNKIFQKERKWTSVQTEMGKHDFTWTEESIDQVPEM